MVNFEPNFRENKSTSDRRYQEKPKFERPFESATDYLGDVQEKGVTWLKQYPVASAVAAAFVGFGVAQLVNMMGRSSKR